MPACAEVNQALLELRGGYYNTGEQNKDMSKARQARDWKDSLAVVQYLQERNPFSSDPNLRNIATGVHAHPTVNVDTAHSVGAAILKSMEGKTSDEHTLGGRTKLSLSAKSRLSRSTERKPRLIHSSSSMDSSLLHQTSDELESAFKYELCSYPPALFDSSLLLSEAHKPALADDIWVLLGPDVQADVPNKGVDMYWTGGGGALIQRIPWSRGSTCRCIVKQYTEYVTHNNNNCLFYSDYSWLSISGRFT